MTKKVLVILEPIYSTYEPLKSLEILLRKIEIKYIISPKIKEIMKHNETRIFSSDHRIISISKSNGFENTFEIDCNWTFDVETKSREITDNLNNIWINKDALNFNGKNFSTVLKCGIIWDIYEHLSQFLTYQCLIKDENVYSVFSENSNSLAGKIIESASHNLEVRYSSIYNSVYRKIRNFFFNLMKFKGFKSLFKEIGLYIKIRENSSHKSTKKKILVDAIYKNYLNNIIPVIENEFLKKEFDIYFLSQNTDLKDKNLKFKTIQKFKFKGKLKETKKLLDELFDRSGVLDKVFEYENVNLQWLKDELYSIIKKELPYLLRKMEIAETLFDDLSPDIVLIGDDRSEVTRAGILPAKQRNIPVFEIQHGLYNQPKLMFNLISDKICVWGEYTKKILLEAGISPEDIEITGSPYYDNLANINIQSKSGKPYKTLLFATQPTNIKVNLKIVDKIGTFMNKSEEFKLIIKPHPLENKDIYQDFSKKFPNKVFIKDINDDITKLLINSDILLLESSTVGLEAALLEKPIIGINFNNNKSVYISGNVAVEVTNIRDLINSIIEIANNEELNKKLSEARSKFVYEQTYLKDGKSSERIAKIIKSTLN
jgi:UDP-N-acetylglucosamine 2-epimerase